MNIKDLKKELEKDLEIDLENLQNESIKVAGLHGKWLGFAMDESGKLVALKSKMKRLKLRKWNYYLGRGTAAEYKAKPFQLKVLKSEVQQYVDADDDVRALEDQIEVKEAIVDFLEGAVRAVSGKQWHIKNAIEFLKFKNGIV
jgi:hypothetical protein